MSRRSRKRRDADGASLSFLDAISCGFGAIVMLLVLTKIGEPIALETAREDLDARIAALEEELGEIRRLEGLVDRDIVVKTRLVESEDRQIERLRGDLTRIQGEFAASSQLSEIQEGQAGHLVAAQQTLTEEMQRLLKDYQRPKDDHTIGGVPVDSEYIIFVIDTSGSMFTFAWSLVIQKMEEVLNVHPTVKGIQVMNDMGQYMFSSYSGKWIPDTPKRRKLIIGTLRQWNVFSNSSPVEGVRRAIVNFAKPDKKVSIYVFGDEFTGDSIQGVLEEVAKYNERDSAGHPKVRIHAVGFPVTFLDTGMGASTGIRFSTLMRALCHKNGGTFVGLNSIRP